MAYSFPQWMIVFFMLTQLIHVFRHSRLSDRVRPQRKGPLKVRGGQGSKVVGGSQVVGVTGREPPE